MPNQQQKFDGINFSNSEVSLLRPDHFENYGRGFRCIRNEFKTYWNKRIKRETDSNIGRCWVIIEQGSLAGYITLLADKLSSVSEGAKLLADEEIKYQTYPAIKIGLLAADYRAKGAGTRLMDWALQYIATELVPKVGIRFITVDALVDKDTHYDASGFYQHKYGFINVNSNLSDEIHYKVPYKTMYLDINPLVKALKEPTGK